MTALPRLTRERAFVVLPSPSRYRPCGINPSKFNGFDLSQRVNCAIVNDSIEAESIALEDIMSLAAPSTARVIAQPTQVEKGWLASNWGLLAAIAALI
ncbi:MAG: hypothetical protein HYX37_07460, partial [Rhizobiales bacterium]|nr:hypothetical protein [Hyphomicrobiales bacterium]